MTDHADRSTSHPGSGSGVVHADSAACADGSTADEHAPGPGPARGQEHQRPVEQGEQDFAWEMMGDDDEPHEEMLERLRATRATLAARRCATPS